MAAYPEDGDGGVTANGVGGITFVFTRVFCDLEVHDAQLGVVVFADDEEAARGVDDILLGARRVRTHRTVREAEPGPRDAVRSQQDTGWDKGAVSSPPLPQERGTLITTSPQYQHAPDRSKAPAAGPPHSFSRLRERRACPADLGEAASAQETRLQSPAVTVTGEARGGL